MNYFEFKKKIQNSPVFSAKDIILLGEDVQLVRNQIRRWQNRGLLIKLKRGLYILNETDRKLTPSRLFIANQLYGPSYASLEYALGFYGLIPERVADITSVTTRKTKQFKNVFGTFIYRHIKPDCFSGYTIVKDEVRLSFFIAEPEKAVVDFLYFNMNSFKQSDLKVFEQGYRLQNISNLKQKKILKFAEAFQNKKFLNICKQFCDFIKEKRHD
jgi:hypothetical protein